jgi:peroxiredoxin
MDTKTLFVVLLVAGILGGFSINTYMNDDVLENDIVDIKVGSEAPDFTLTDTEGNEFSLSDYEGEKVLVLEFMNMNCGTCKNFEKDAMKSYCNESMPEDVEVISVTQTKNTDEGKLAERTDEMGWRFMKGSDEMTDTFGADRSPTVVIIDKDGIITFLESGSMSKSELEENINAALE